MSSKSPNLWQFGDFRLDVSQKVLRHRERTVAVPLKELELLSMLVRNQGELVTKSELLDEVWEDSFVEESNLSRHIYLLRKTLKDLGADEGLIENVPRRGYRFTGEVKPVEADEILVGKHTRSRTLIELREEELRNFPDSRLYPVAFAAVVLTIAVAVAGYLAYRQAGPAPAANISSIAVLPFKTINPGAANDHSGDALADILTTRLSNVKSIRTRPAMAAATAGERDAISAGKMLGVDAVLDGSIYHAGGERIRVTARLIDVRDASIIWSGEFEKLKHDELSLHHQLAMQIVPAIAFNLSPREQRAIEKKYTDNPVAYDLYLKGRYEWNKRSTPGMVEAQRLFRNAIEADPKFALAHVGLADTLLTNQPYASEARFAITSALELDPELAEAHASQGFYLMFYDWNWSEAEAAFRRSIDLNPNYPTAHHWYATLLSIKGDIESAKAEMRKALELNPTSHNFLADLGQLHYFSNEFVEAEKICLRALELYPDFMFAHEYLYAIYLKTGQFEKAIAEIAKADAINTGFATAGSPKGEDPLGKYSEGFRRSGIKGYLDIRHPGAPTGPETFYLYAKKYALIGENEKALDCLERSTGARMFLSAFLKADPVFEGLRSEARFQKMLKGMGLS